MVREPLDRVLLGYSAAIALLIVLAWPRVPHAPALLAALRRSREPVRVWTRALLCALWVPLAFTELGLLVHHVHPRDYELQMIAWDRALFGTDPTVWMQRLQHPLLTEVLQLCYVSYYFLPVALVLSVLWSGRYETGLRALTGIVTAFYLSYLGYFVFPSHSPYVSERLWGVPHHDVPLQGLWLAGTLHQLIDRLEPIKRDAFPSGHTEVTLVVLWYAFLHDRRRTFPVLLVLGVGLLFSTVYLRYHYVVDLLAGAALAPLALAITWALYSLRESRAEVPSRARPPVPAGSQSAPS
jgi:membrane-associated phospholipid phosphatase